MPFSNLISKLSTFILNMYKVQFASKYYKRLLVLMFKLPLKCVLNLFYYGALRFTFLKNEN